MLNSVNSGNDVNSVNSIDSEYSVCSVQRGATSIPGGNFSMSVWNMFETRENEKLLKEMEFWYGTRIMAGKE